MCSGFAGGRWFVALIASCLMLLAVPAASALGAAQVRFVHTVPGAGPQQLEASAGGRATAIGGPVGFGQVGGYAKAPSGEVSLRIRGAEGSRTSQRLRKGARYTVVALGTGSPELAVLRDGGARAGSAQLRVVHAAPELGNVDVRLGDMRFANLPGFRETTDYRRVDPGAYAVRVTRPGDGATLAARGGVPLTAGTSSTAFVVGSAGEPIDVVVAADGAAAPRGAPATGLGGLADEGDDPLLLALLAGLLAATLGAGVYLARTGRARGRGA